MKKQPLLLIILVLFACNNDSEVLPIDEPKVLSLKRVPQEKSTDIKDCSWHDLFNSQELESITFMIDNFDGYLLSKTEMMEEGSAYEAYCSIFSLQTYSGEYLNLADVNSLEYKKLLETMRNSDVGSDFWVIDPNTRWMNINLQGRYWKWLKCYAEENHIPDLKSYVSSIEDSGAIPPTIRDGFWNNCKVFDFSNLNHRLIWLVHFISVTSVETEK